MRKQFTLVSNEVLLDESLTAQEKVAWAKLCMLCLTEEVDTGSLTGTAARINFGHRHLQRLIQSLVEKGFITQKGRGIYQLEAKKVKYLVCENADKPPEWYSVEQLCQECMQIWNKYKPVNAPSIKKFQTARLETLRVYAERFDCDEKTVLRTVLKGSNADEFRREKSWGFINIFGVGVPTEEKQQKVEKVYNLGLSAKGQHASFDVDDDQCWLDWYASKDHDMKRVVRINEDDRRKAWEHHVDNKDDQVIYIYIQSEGYLTHWTFKDNHVGVSYLPSES